MPEKINLQDFNDNAINFMTLVAKLFWNLSLIFYAGEVSIHFDEVPLSIFVFGRINHVRQSEIRQFK